MLRIYLRESEDLAVGQLPPQFPGQLLQVGDLLTAEGKPLLAVESGNVADLLYRLRVMKNMEKLLIKPLIDPL